MNLNFQLEVTCDPDCRAGYHLCRTDLRTAGRCPGPTAVLAADYDQLRASKPSGFASSSAGTTGPGSDFNCTIVLQATPAALVSTGSDTKILYSVLALEVQRWPGPPYSLAPASAEVVSVYAGPLDFSGAASSNGTRVGQYSSSVYTIGATSDGSQAPSTSQDGPGSLQSAVSYNGQLANISC